MTDRGQRYRANRAISAEGGRRCVYCGDPKPRTVDHVNGNESDADPRNLVRACQSCNTKKGIVFLRAGAGVRTHQFNPAQPGRGAGTLAEWLEAVMALKGNDTRFTLSEAIEKVRNTPASKRAEFAAEIWQRRRARGGSGVVPF